uniref:S8 family peptidase n=1 Tax=Nonomuraea pusilla TaxID=46177 RepID=UPI0006E3EBB2|nr:S8 family serine peptidase [Nonomuraea pusilla]
MRPLLACALAVAAISAAISATLAAPPALGADARDTPGAGDGGPAVSPALAAEVRERTRVRSIVEVRPGHRPQDVAADLEQGSNGARILEAAQSPHFFVAELDGRTLRRLMRDDRVKAVYEDELRAPALDVSTKIIGSDRANRAGVTGVATTIAVLDTGIDRDHPFFRGRIVDEACFSSSYAGDGSVSLCPNGQPSQTGPGAADAETAQCVAGGSNACFHGTHVAGIAAGRLTAGAPSDGVAPAAGILPIQVFSRIDSGTVCGGMGASAPCFLSYTSDQKLALEYVAKVAATYRVAAANMSLGGGGPFKEHCDGQPGAASLKPDFDALLALGVAPVVAAGNSGFTDGVSAPACISSAIAVGATDDRDRLASFTNRGKLVDVFAPGVAIDSSVPDDTYRELSGTSMAAPHVAGSFALMRQRFPRNTVLQSLRRLQSTGRPVSYPSGGATVTTPRIDVGAATVGVAADPRR